MSCQVWLWCHQTNTWGDTNKFIKQFGCEITIRFYITNKKAINYLSNQKHKVDNYFTLSIILNNYTRPQLDVKSKFISEYVTEKWCRNVKNNCITIRFVNLAHWLPPFAHGDD